MTARLVCLLLCVGLAPVTLHAAEEHGAPAKPAAAAHEAPVQTPSKTPPKTAALPGRAAGGSPPGAVEAAPVRAAYAHAAGHGVPAAVPAPPTHGASPAPQASRVVTPMAGAASAVAAASAAIAKMTPARPVESSVSGPIDGRGPDRGRAVVRLSSGRTAKARRVVLTWPEPERLKLRWDEPADRVALVWGAEP